MITRIAWLLGLLVGLFAVLGFDFDCRFLHCVCLGDIVLDALI